MTVHTWEDLTAPVERTCDVCVVGSGAGGAVVAAGLAEAGLDVVIVEEGSRVTREDFTLHERDATPMLYQDRGAAQLGGRGGHDLPGAVGRRVDHHQLDDLLPHAGAHPPTTGREVHGIEGLGLDPHFEADRGSAEHSHLG